MAFNQSSASPGDSINVATVTSPGSVVLLSVIDKSLTLLADACKSLESDNVSYQLGDTGEYSYFCATIKIVFPSHIYNFVEYV